MRLETLPLKPCSFPALGRHSETSLRAWWDLLWNLQEAQVEIFLHLFLRRNNWETGEISHSLTLVSHRSQSCLGEMNETLWDLPEPCTGSLETDLGTIIKLFSINILIQNNCILKPRKRFFFFKNLTSSHHLKGYFNVVISNRLKKINNYQYRLISWHIFQPYRPTLTPTVTNKGTVAQIQVFKACCIIQRCNRCQMCFN